MKTFNTKVLLFSMFLIGSSSSLFAQRSNNVASNSVKIEGMTFDYSIGEMLLTSTERNSKLIITQGTLQPVNMNKLTQLAPEELTAMIEEEASAIKVFPNPANSVVNILFESGMSGEFHTNLYDATGKLIISQKAEQKNGSNQHSINVSSYAAGNYFLLIKLADDKFYSFKINKTN